MTYFKAIEKRVSELDVLAQSYLDKLSFMSNDDVCERLYQIALEIDKSKQENPEWVDFALDGFIPYSSPPKLGSLYSSLGFSCVAQDALLRNLLEVAEGRETKHLDFPCLAEQDIVLKYAEKMEIKTMKPRLTR